MDVFTNLKRNCAAIPTPDELDFVRREKGAKTVLFLR